MASAAAYSACDKAPSRDRAAASVRAFAGSARPRCACAAKASSKSQRTKLTLARIQHLD